VHAIVVRAPGGPEQLSWTEVPDPRPAAGEVLLAVAATAVNRADVLQRRGFYPPPPGASEVLGLECAGVVRAVGTGVTGWSVGDEACALLTGGGYAELVAVPAGQLLPVPRGLDLVTAATLPEVASTVWSNLVMVGGLAAGQSVLLHGGTGGVGVHGIQVAKALGATVITTVGSAAKAERARSLGADVVLDYRTDDLPGAVRAATDGRGVDLVLDVVGGPTLDANLRSLATGGTLVVIGLQGGRTGSLDLGRLLAIRGRVVGTTLRSRPVDEKAAVVAAVREHVWPMVEDGRVRPVVDRVLPVTEAAEAHRVLEASEHVGKVALRVG
jgi:putative PIG3 family NAD(P)H quinone oxidoreductase